MLRLSMIAFFRCFTRVGLLLLLTFPIGRAQGPAPIEKIVSELRSNQAADALRDANLALKANPGDARLWILKGVAANQLTRSDEALAAFESALRIAPHSLPALEGASEIAFRIDRSRARDLVARLLIEDPANPGAHGMAAMLDVDAGDWAAAVAHFSQAGATIEHQPAALRAQAISLDHLGRYREAAEIFTKIVQASPDDAQARYNLAVLELRAKQFHEALNTLQPMLTAHSEPSLSLAATLYEQLGDTPNAVASLRTAIAEDPKDPQNYLDFASLSFDHSSFAAGIAMLNAGLTQLPNNASLYIARGALYMQSSQLDLAEKDFETANRLEPGQSYGLEAQSLTEMQQHNLPEALVKVKISLEKTPESAYLNYLAAEILKEQGVAPGSAEARQERQYAERAVQLDEKLVAALDLLSGLDFQAGDYAGAAAQCRLALREHPADQEALFRLILSLRRTGDSKGEVPGLLASLEKARADEHTNQVRIDRYRLSEAPAVPSASATPATLPQK